MLAAKVTIGSIDYEGALEAVLPMLIGSLPEEGIPPMAAKILRRLGDDAAPIAARIVGRLPEETKAELAAMLLNAYSDLVRDALNAQLAKNRHGRHVRIGDVFLVAQGGALHMWLGQVRIDYRGLIESALPGIAGRAAGRLVDERLERRALGLLWNDDSRQRVLGMAADAMARSGIAMELEGIELMEDAPMPSPGYGRSAQIDLTDDMEGQLLDAIAGYLRDGLAGEGGDPGAASAAARP